MLRFQKFGYLRKAFEEKTFYGKYKKITLKLKTDRLYKIYFGKFYSVFEMKNSEGHTWITVTGDLLNMRCFDFNASSSTTTCPSMR